MLAADKRGRSGGEPSGAPETLAGRLSKMGDRVSFAKPERPAADAEAAKRKKRRGAGGAAAGDGMLTTALRIIWIAGASKVAPGAHALE